MRVGPLILSLDGKLLGPRRMTKKINVLPEWTTLQTLTNELACLDGKLLGPRRMTKKINVHPEWKTLQTLTNELACFNQVQNKCWNECFTLPGGVSGHIETISSSLIQIFEKMILSERGCCSGNSWFQLNVESFLLTLAGQPTADVPMADKTNDESGTPRSQSGWKTSWAKKDDKEDECASRVEDSLNTNQWGKKEAGSSPPSSVWMENSWAKRIPKEDECAAQWKILQTLTNGAKRKLDHLLLHLVKINMCAVDVARSSLDFSNTNKWGKKKAGSSPSSSGKWAAVNDESGTPRSQSGWKTSWAKKDDKEDQCASRVEDSSNTNQWGKKEAGSSPSSSGKWAAPLAKGSKRLVKLPELPSSIAIIIADGCDKLTTMLRVLQLMATD
ncbi:hypothetical protein Tco_0673773 [Tanacetum coccineum]